MSAHRKMVLLEQAEVERLRQKQIRDYNPTLSAMARAQGDLENILTNNKLTGEEKMILLQEAQQRFTHLKSTMGPIAGAPSVSLAQAQTKPSDVKVADDTATEGDLDSVKYMIADHPKVMRANKSGELVFKGRRVAGSSFQDLFDSLSASKQIDQPGMSQFIAGLKLLNAPSDVIRNPIISSHLSTPDSDPNLNLSTHQDTSRKGRSSKLHSQKGKGNFSSRPSTKKYERMHEPFPIKSQPKSQPGSSNYDRLSPPVSIKSKPFHVVEKSNSSKYEQLTQKGKGNFSSRPSSKKYDRMSEPFPVKSQPKSQPASSNYNLLSAPAPIKSKPYNQTEKRNSSKYQQLTQAGKGTTKRTHAYLPEPPGKHPRILWLYH